MKKFTFPSLFLCGVLGAGNAFASTQLDVSHVTMQNEFSVTFGAYFETGFDAQNKHQTDFGAGRMDTDAVNMAYTPTDDWTILFAIGENNYSDSQIGVQYKLVKSPAFNLLVQSDYGIAWTKGAGGGRFGNNNVDGGVTLHGTLYDDWQWSLSAMGQYVFMDGGNFWNANMTAQLMYYITPHLAPMIEFDFNFLQINRPRTWYDKELTLGMVYNIGQMTAINPFVTYHFKTKDFQTEYISYYDWWKIGIDMSVRF